MTHYCFNCEAPSIDSDVLPGGKVVWICGDQECIKAFEKECKAEENDAKVLSLNQTIKTK